MVQHQFPDSKVHGANMSPIWGQQDPDGPHVGPMNFAIWVIIPCSGPILTFVWLTTVVDKLTSHVSDNRVCLPTQFYCDKVIDK